MAPIDGIVSASRSSNEDIESTAPSSQHGSLEPLKGAVKEKHVGPPQNDDGIPPPAYTVSTNSHAAFHDGEEEERPRGILAWFNRHRVTTSTILVIFCLCILGSLIYAFFMVSVLVRCGSDCGEAVYYKADMCPLAREDLLRKELSSSTTVELPKPTGFAEGDPRRLVYTNVGGSRPVVGSSFTVVIQPGYQHRIFYHDTTGQIYESAFKSYDGPSSNYDSNGVVWEVYKVPGAVMAVNTSLAAAVVKRTQNEHSTTALYFHPTNDTRIARILSDSPGTYRGPNLSPFSSHDKSLAATAVGSRILLAYREEGYTAVGDGWWNETDQSDTARHARNIHITDASLDSHLSMQAVPTDLFGEGFVLAYQRRLDAGTLETVLRYAVIAPSLPLEAAFVLSHEATSWPSLNLIPSYRSIGPNHFSVVQLRGGNFTYEAYELGFHGKDVNEGVEITHVVLGRQQSEQAYYCTFGDQPILKHSDTSEYARRPPMWGFISWSPLAGVEEWGFSWIYMLRKPENETQSARLSVFQHYSGYHTPPVFERDVPLFSLSGRLNNTSTSATSGSMPSTHTMTTSTTPRPSSIADAMSAGVPQYLVPPKAWSCDSGPYGMC